VYNNRNYRTITLGIVYDGISYNPASGEIITAWTSDQPAIVSIEPDAARQAAKEQAQKIYDAALKAHSDASDALTKVAQEHDYQYYETGSWRLRGQTLLRFGRLFLFHPVCRATSIMGAFLLGFSS